MNIKKLQEKYFNKELSVVDYASELLERIEKNNFNSFLTIDKEAVLANAKKLDEKLAKGEKLGKLFGVPMSIKDNILTKGLRTTAASKSLEDFVPVFNATVVEKIEAQDGLIIGKANMDEFAMGGSSETSAFGHTINPFDHRLIPGGSSSGSAASVAGEEVLVSLGTDTGGSVRNPANFCNIVGLAPTYGSISRFGVISMANSFDRVGVLGKSVADVRSLFEVCQGLDENDYTSISLEKKSVKSLEGVKIAYAKLLDAYECEEQVVRNYEKTLEFLRNQGAILEEVELHLLSRINQVYTIIMSVEAAANMSRVDGIRYGSSLVNDGEIEDLYRKNRTQFFGEEIQRRIALGNFFSSKETDQAYYKKAMQVRQMLKEMFDEILERNDYFISPTNTHLPYELGAKADDANAAYDSGMFNTITNLINLPSISIPVDKELLGSVQIIAKRKEDYALLDLAELIEGGLN